MIFVPTDKLIPGMILGRDLYFPNLNPHNLCMLSRGERLKDIYITKIMQFGIPGVYIENANDLGLSIQDFFDEQIRKTAQDLQSVFDDFKKNNYMLNKRSIEQVSDIACNLVQSVKATEDCTINLIDLKYYDGYTYQHSLSVAILSILTGISIGLVDNLLKDLAISALLHDIGKMVIPLDIINKPGRLSDAEYTIVKQHPLNAIRHLSRKNLVNPAILFGIENHHEKMDGTGYPNGLKGDAIPVFGRILAVSDVFDALTSDRPYRKKWSPSDAIEYMMACTDSHFDCKILTAFLRSVAVYPVGSCVLLSNGQRAVVIRNLHENVLRPVIRILCKDGLDHEVNMLEDKAFKSVTIIDYSANDKSRLVGRCENN